MNSILTHIWVYHIKTMCAQIIVDEQRHGGSQFCRQQESANAGVCDRGFKWHRQWRSENAKNGYVKDTLEYRLNVSKV